MADELCALNVEVVVSNFAVTNNSQTLLQIANNACMFTKADTYQTMAKPQIQSMYIA